MSIQFANFKLARMLFYLAWFNLTAYLVFSSIVGRLHVISVLLNGLVLIGSGAIYSVTKHRHEAMSQEVPVVVAACQHTDFIEATEHKTGKLVAYGCKNPGCMRTLYADEWKPPGCYCKPEEDYYLLTCSVEYHRAKREVLEALKAEELESFRSQHDANRDLAVTQTGGVSVNEDQGNSVRRRGVVGGGWIYTHQPSVRYPDGSQASLPGLKPPSSRIPCDELDQSHVLSAGSSRCIRCGKDYESALARRLLDKGALDELDDMDEFDRQVYAKIAWQTWDTVVRSAGTAPVVIGEQGRSSEVLSPGEYVLSKEAVYRVMRWLKDDE